MHIYNYVNLKKLMIPMDTMLLISRLHEYMGKQGLFKLFHPQILTSLEKVVGTCLSSVDEETPGVLKYLYQEFRERRGKEDVEPLIFVSIFMLDLLCTQPSIDSNGQLACLHDQFGFEIGRYIDLDKIVEDSKESYYVRLRQSSEGWSENQNDIFPWVNYLLGTLIETYEGLELEFEKDRE